MSRIRQVKSMSRAEDSKFALEITVRGLRRLSDLIVIEFPEESGTQIESLGTRSAEDGTQIYDQ